MATENVYVETSLAPADLVVFNHLHEAGMWAKEGGRHEEALEHFRGADILTVQTAGDNDPKRLDALNPMARAFWSLGRYDEAVQALETAHDVALELGLRDQIGITQSNIGRLGAVKTVRTVPVDEHPG